MVRGLQTAAPLLFVAWAAFPKVNRCTVVRKAAAAHTHPGVRNLCGAHVTPTESLRRGRVGPLASTIHTLPSYQHTPRPAKPSHPPPPPRPLASLISASSRPAGENFAGQFFQLLRSPTYPPAPQDAATQGWMPRSLPAATVAPAARAAPLHWEL